MAEFKQVPGKQFRGTHDRFEVWRRRWLRVQGLILGIVSYFTCSFVWLVPGPFGDVHGFVHGDYCCYPQGADAAAWFLLGLPDMPITRQGFCKSARSAMHRRNFDGA